MASLQLFTDFVCPFCFIAEQSTVPRLLRDFDLTLDWCGFELHPSTPRGGRPLADLFPGVDLEALHERTKSFAASFGVTDFEPPQRLQNSQRCLGLAEVARDENCLPELRQAAFEAHWRRGADLEDEAALAEIARSAGLDPIQALQRASQPELLERVHERQLAARRAGVRGVPTFRIGSESIVGCQPYAALSAAAERAGVPRRARD